MIPHIYGQTSGRGRNGRSVWRVLGHEHPPAVGAVAASRPPDRMPDAMEVERLDTMTWAPWAAPLCALIALTVVVVAVVAVVLILAKSTRKPESPCLAAAFSSG